MPVVVPDRLFVNNTCISSKEFLLTCTKPTKSRFSCCSSKYSSASEGTRRWLLRGLPESPSATEGVGGSLLWLCSLAKGATSEDISGGGSRLRCGLPKRTKRRCRRIRLGSEHSSGRLLRRLTKNAGCGSSRLGTKSGLTKCSRSGSCSFSILSVVLNTQFLERMLILLFTNMTTKSVPQESSPHTPACRRSTGTEGWCWHPSLQW